MLLINFAIFLVALIVLIISGGWLVRSLTKISSILRFSQFITGFVIMAFATSIPELFVSIAGSIKKTPEIVLGTIIGSNLADLTIVLGITLILAKKVKIETKQIKKDAVYMLLFMSLAPVLMFIDGVLSRIDGVIIIAALLFYVNHLFRNRTELKEKVKDGYEKKEAVFETLLFVFSLIVLLFSAKLVVKYTELLAIGLSLPQLFIALFIVAIGTSLPELIFGARAVLVRQPDMNLGNIIGSVIVNSTLVLGIAAIINPLTAEPLLYFIATSFMILSGFIFMAFVEISNKLHWKEGVSLVLLYFLFVLIQFYIHFLETGAIT